MSGAEEEVRFSLKVMINKEKTKVLFAVVDNNFADVLLSFLTLPLGVILRLLNEHYGDQAPAIGSLNTLRSGLVNLEISYFCTEVGKLMLLNPRNSLYAECCRLKINVDDTEPIKYFACEKWDCGLARTSLGMYHSTARSRCCCTRLANRQIFVRDYYSQDRDRYGGFTVQTVSFLISDDLRILPNLTGSIMQSLNTLGVNDMEGAEQRTVTVGFQEIMHLLKASLFSETPLTEVILQPRQMHHHSLKAKSENFTFVSQKVKKESSNSEKIKVNVMVQKSTNKLLFVQSEANFIDFLFSFLTIPLGDVENLLGSSSSLGSVDNLYKSLENMNVDKYFRNRDKKDMLLKPKLPPKFLSKNQIFSLTEQDHPQLCYCKNHSKKISFLAHDQRELGEIDFKDPKGEGSYVKGPGMFMVTDNLTVRPICLFSSLSILKEMDISLSDVEELEIGIGLEEGISILKASLTSTSALSKDLGPFLMKQPKEERY